MIAILCLVAAVLLLIAEDNARRSWKRSFLRERRWNQEHTPAPPVRNEYEQERATDHRGPVREWTPPVSGIEHTRGTR